MFPRGVRRTVGQALVVEDDVGKTYRAVYTVKFASVVYVLHAFQKKSKSGSKTPPEEIEKVKSRLREAEKDYAEWTEQQKRKHQDDH
jgi:phage-related protein